jgi:tRNA (adenine22-N1)-methyltransferase
MPAPALSRRLDAILAMLRPCGVLADICSDHALLALAAVVRGLAGRAIAIDLNAAPLAVAAANQRAAGLGDAVSLRQGDGLQPLAPGEAEAVVLAGIGAQLAVRLLDAAPDRLSAVRQVIVQPNQQPERVRAWAARAGWHLTDETVVAEDGRYFHVLAFHPGTGPDPAYTRAGFTPDELIQLGPGLLARQDADTRAFLRARVDRLTALLGRHPTPALTAEHALWARAAAQG